jgi:hypothetical protein
VPVSGKSGKYYSNPATMRMHEANAVPATPAPAVGTPTDTTSPMDSDQTAQTVICPKCGTEFAVPGDNEQDETQAAAPVVPVTTKA